MIITTVTDPTYLKVGGESLTPPDITSLNEAAEQVEWITLSTAEKKRTLPMMQGLAFKHLVTILPPAVAIGMGSWRVFGLLAYRDFRGMETFWIDEGDALTCVMHRQVTRVELDPATAHMVRLAEQRAKLHRQDVAVVLYTNNTTEKRRFRLFPAELVKTLAPKACKLGETPRIAGYWHYRAAFWSAASD